jgi:hypothetical protein
MESTTCSSEIDEVVQRLGCASVPDANSLTIGEARFLVDVYYRMLENGKAAGNQAPALVDSRERHGVIHWLLDLSEVLERQIQLALDSWTDTLPAARWAKSIPGIDAVISAGLAAHIDIRRCPTAGRIWRFAGLDPTVEWKNGQRRPWNPTLKRLACLAGENFAKAAGSEANFYGQLYLQRKQIEQQQNEAGKYADQSYRKLAQAGIGRHTEAYKWYSQGKLPPAHIHSRAKRWTVKLFLAHYHHVAWTLATGTPPPRPYVISIMGHADFIAPPIFGGRRDTAGAGMVGSNSSRPIRQED